MPAKRTTSEGHERTRGLRNLILAVKVSILQQPNQGNDYTLIVEFDDVILPDKTYGDEWYEIHLTARK